MNAYYTDIDMNRHYIYRSKDRPSDCRLLTEERYRIFVENTEEIRRKLIGNMEYEDIPGRDALPFVKKAVEIAEQHNYAIEIINENAYINVAYYLENGDSARLIMPLIAMSDDIKLFYNSRIDRIVFQAKYYVKKLYIDGRLSEPLF